MNDTDVEHSHSRNALHGSERFLTICHGPTCWGRLPRLYVTRFDALMNCPQSEAHVQIDDDGC